VAPDTAAWQALERFDPRRPTFIVMQGLPPAQVERLLQALRARSAGFSRPVRVLVLLEPGSAAPAAADHIPA
jgi:O-methyltransferase involved in polyketide biosynthesis